MQLDLQLTERSDSDELVRSMSANPSPTEGAAGADRRPNEGDRGAERFYSRGGVLGCEGVSRLGDIVTFYFQTGEQIDGF
jgi:hypothetical protein